MVGPLLLVLFLLIVVGAVPAIPSSRKWSFMPSAALGLVVLVMVFTLLASVI